MNNCNEFIKSSSRLIGVGVTTYPNQESANTLIENLITDGLITCGQIDGPIKSIYKWNGGIEVSNEWRITIKFISKNRKKIEEIINQSHPYELPQWITYDAESTKAYYEWVKDPNK